MLLSACLLGMPGAAQSPQQSGKTGITIQINALNSNAGTVYCDLYNEAKGFPNKPERALSSTKAQPQNNKAVCVFSNVKPGRYAVAVWQDINSNGKLDTSWIGIPNEPVGSSNNAKGKLGPPKFKDATFDYAFSGVTQTIILD
ncbi:DUF2141 domain-containing protein [Blastomonas sp.]|uniref:DUF2141 domain-containing protein n=1 Tax=Blastomonas sp. TaxID=1909299 RepID=UPI0035930EC3